MSAFKHWLLDQDPEGPFAALAQLIEDDGSAPGDLSRLRDWLTARVGPEHLHVAVFEGAVRVWREAGAAREAAPTGADDAFALSDAGAAEFFASLDGYRVRYDHRQGRWLLFDGVRWAPDRERKVEALILVAMRARQRAAAGEKARVAHAVRSEDRIRLIAARAQVTSAITDDGKGWDEDAWLLGVPNGVVDLRTGELRGGRPEDRITMQASPSFDPDARCPLWEATIADLFKDNPELVPYLQRALGYSLTGDCREEVFFLLTGGGRNGKGTVANTVRKILGDYADDLAFHSLERGRDGDKSTNDLAKLAGRRFVTASETSGARFNESRIKMLTGRDPVTARFLFKEEFTYEPSLKLWLSVNHLPKVHDDSMGFWSRPHRVPFLQCYKGREDETLKDRLLGEGPGILAWMVRGCLAWQAAGLMPPDVVRAAVEEYRQSQEPLADFYAEETTADARASAPAADLFARYRAWCDEKRLFKRLGRNQFNAELKKRHRVEHTRSGATCFGLRVADTGTDQGAML